MTHTSQSISPLRQRMNDDMRMRKFAPKTQACYIRVVRQFTAFLGRAPDTATIEDLRRYQLHLVDHDISPISLNAAIAGLKFFFGITLERPELMLEFRIAASRDHSGASMINNNASVPCTRPRIQSEHRA